MTEKYVEESHHTLSQWIFTIIASLPVFTYGVQAGWMSPMSKLLTSPQSPTDHPLSDSELAWLASVMPFGAIISTSVFSLISDAYGRKISLICIMLCQILTFVIKLSSLNFYSLVISRLICGIASGGCFNVPQLYCKEISHDSIRGNLVSVPNLFMNLGFLVIYAIGLEFSYQAILWIGLAVPLFNLALMLWTPETPPYLVKIGNEERAAKNLISLRKSNYVIEKELSLMKSERGEETCRQISYSQIFKNQIYLKSFLIVLSVILIQATNGTFVIITYAAKIMVNAGVTLNPDLQTLSFPAVMIVGSLLLTGIVERINRRTLNISLLGLSGVSFGIFATGIYIQSKGGWMPGWIPVISIIAITFSYAAGLAALPYIVISEIFNLKIRSKVMGLLVSLAWLSSFIQVLAYPVISRNVGDHVIFYGFCLINLSGVAVSLFLLPETRGKSVDELEMELSGRNNIDSQEELGVSINCTK